MGFQSFYPTIPTIPLICTFRHISLIVLRFLKGKSVILTTMAVVLMTMAVVLRTMAVVLGTMAVVLGVLGIGIYIRIKVVKVKIGIGYLIQGQGSSLLRCLVISS